MNPRKAAAGIDDDEDPLSDLVSDKKLEKFERESYKHSFLTKLMEKFEDIESKHQGITSPKSFSAAQTPKKLPLTKMIADARALEIQT